MEIELRTCDPAAPAQHWNFSEESAGWQIKNVNSDNCIWNGAPLPLRPGGRPISQRGCYITNTTIPASNALWKPSSLTGVTQLMSRVQHRDTGFCIDVPGGNPFETATMQNWGCNGTAAQEWIIVVD